VEWESRPAGEANPSKALAPLPPGRRKKGSLCRAIPLNVLHFFFILNSSASAYANSHNNIYIAILNPFFL
jgi:hypothetical protein